ncbi:translation elongation factor Ts [Sphaerochaeta sp.]|jgi:elongation factor Ts|uniref:Elongation factor Ts n=1 Tax=bioreactor metagenome TaxID=1076179 RepID=A0A644WSK1_9ZZZZ|nr:translation elongation factor Ts [Sphaerochaeta sp.]MDD2394928.1 translation elongation factor Ts [Sphaerochaeta sp.]MDD3423880.1 translation elongation factor Ts [Sphaerochaeta sp.]MDD3456354.1 translation elongation factor Ts [Sphaerochaeta sp.]MDD4037624.1 translation elongation factor Ts [Sphaerochaeta sp.]MDX9982936.1 translation elongation factor Ts [Sphaerochaeta sp.]
MAITADEVKKLREITGAGMMDCKKALTQANGDFAAAERLLKEMGLAAIAKRQDRATDNGRVFVKVEKNKAVMAELSCETDFVATNEQFAELGNKICDVALAKGYTEINDELTGMVNDLIAIIKENMGLKNLCVFDLGANEYASSYIHGNGSLGVLVMFKADKAELFENELVKELTNDCALHVAAFTPSYLNISTVDEAYIKEQTEIFTVQAAKLDKPAKVLEGIVKGKLSKHLAEICFLQQPFVKDDSMSVEKKVAEVGKSAGGKLEIVNFSFLRAGVASCSN